ncbi:type II toxin-antitoxin system Phd/YefM family antitoxin [Streptomyces sp. NBC_00057]|uniref:type II toxin-antitoxin system Phd/YefM family antitoxin n=1 Tax=Streptomyces sp. NBC_00057 TaxID=2975634 RepID=UPI0032512B54
MEATRQCNVHEAKTHLTRILEQAVTGEEALIPKAEPGAKIVPLPPSVKRAGRGSLQGQIHIKDGFDDLPDDMTDVFGAR